MNKKKNLLNLFSKDTSYNYHLVKTDEPIGHLIYLIQNGLNLSEKTLEFSPTKIVEELINECSIKIEKFAPSIFFTDEIDTKELKEKLNDKLSETKEFSEFIENIKDEYRILEVKDSLLFKKDPEAYEQVKRKEYEEHQKELWDEMMKHIKKSKKQRENAIKAYNNDLIKLLKEYFENIIEFEKGDFNLDQELEKIVGDLIDETTWIKINNIPFICRIEIISLEQDRMKVFLTDNNNYSYTATLKLDDAVLITENVQRLEKFDELPKTLFDYEVISKLYDIDTNLINEWEFKNHTDRFNYIINYLVPIFQENKNKREKELLDKIKEEEKEEL